MDARTRLTRCLTGVAALSLMAAITACAAAPKKISGAYDAQDVALRSGANISHAVARSLNDVPDARGASGLVFGNVALIATDLKATGSTPLVTGTGPSQYGAPGTAESTRSSVPGGKAPTSGAAGIGNPPVQPGGTTVYSTTPTTMGVTGNNPMPSVNNPQGVASTPNTPGNTGGMSSPGMNGVNAPPDRSRVNLSAARPGGGASEGPSIPGGTPSEVGSTPGTLRAEALGTSGQPAGPGTTTATGPQERYTRLAQSLQADYPQIKEVRFVTNMTHAKRLAAIADAMRRGNSIAPYMGELAAIFSDSIPAGVTKIPRNQMPQPGYGIPPGP